MKILLSVILMAVLSACATNPAYDPNAFVQAHPELPDAVKSMILKNEIAVGMTKAEVAASWGPMFVLKQSSVGDEWIYNCQPLDIQYGCPNMVIIVFNNDGVVTYYGQ